MSLFHGEHRVKDRIIPITERRLRPLDGRPLDGGLPKRRGGSSAALPAPWRLMAAAAACLAVLLAASPAPASEKEAGAGRDPGPFLAGVDVSHLALFEKRGKTYKDQGKARDALEILTSRGVNAVRLRIWTGTSEEAAKDPYNRGNTLEYTIPLAQRVKKARLHFLLDFHYSDSWADPGTQKKPETWKDLPFDALQQRMFEYNRDVIAALKRAGAMPDAVQVGNEITPGMLWPDGRVGGPSDTPEQWARLGDLLKAAIRGIREAAGTQPPKIMIHIDRGGSWGVTQWFFDHLRDQKVEYDILGESYYPFWHGTLEDLRTCLTNAAARYGKEVVVVETAFPWEEPGGKPVAGIEPGPEGQCRFVEALGRIVKEVPGGKGRGIYWWAAEFVPSDGLNLAGFERRSFFDRDGNALPVIEAFGKLARGR